MRITQDQIDAVTLALRRHPTALYTGHLSLSEWGRQPNLVPDLGVVVADERGRPASVFVVSTEPLPGLVLRTPAEASADAGIWLKVRDEADVCCRRQWCPSLPRAIAGRVTRGKKARTA